MYVIKNPVKEDVSSYICLIIMLVVDVKESESLIE